MGALLMAPPVQGWLIRRLVAAQPGWKVEFERIGVGPTGADARGLKFSMPGVEASSAPITVRVAPSRLLSKRELRIERVDAQRLRLSVTPAQLPASPPFDGLLKFLQIPLPWALDAADIAGEIDLRNATSSQVKGAFTLKGGGVSAKAPGEFSYALHLDSALLPSAASENQIHSAGRIRLTQDDAHGVARLELAGDLRAPPIGGRTLPPGKLTVKVMATPTGETYDARITLGDGTVLQIDASLDAARTDLTGTATFHLDPSLLTTLSPRPYPTAEVGGRLRFQLNFATADLDAVMESTFTLGEWRNFLPQLAALDAFKGELKAALQRRAGRLTLQSLDGTLRGLASPAEARLKLIAPIDPLAPPTGPLAELRLARFPARWAHPLLGSAELGGGWSLALTDLRHVQLTPDQALTLGPLSFPSEILRPLAPATLSLSPRVDLDPDRQTLTIPDLRLTTASGERVEARVVITRENASGQVGLQGALRADLPTLLATKTTPFAVSAQASVNAQLDSDGRRLRVAAFDLNAHDLSRSDTPPYLAVALSRPIGLDLVQAAPPSATDGTTSDWLRATVQALPLGWLSRWTQDLEVGGALEQGELAFSSTPEGAWAWRTLTPWKATALTVTSAGNERFQGSVSASLGGTLRGSQLTTTVEQLSVLHQAGYQLSGQVAASADLAEKTGEARLALDAAIPSLPGALKAVGPVQASLRTTVHTMVRRILAADNFVLEVRHAEGELLSARTRVPFLFGLNDHGMVAITTVGPLPLRIGAVPLEWLRPLTGELTLDGQLASSEFEFNANINDFSLRSVAPLVVANVVAHHGEQELARGATLTVTPSAQFSLLCAMEPKFALAYSGSLHLADLRVDAGNARVLDLDATLGFKGNDQLILPDALQLTSQLDFASAARLPAATAFGLPTRGSWQTRVDGELLAEKPAEMVTRLSGLPNAQGTGDLPPLELKLRGKISREQVFSGGAELLLSASPRPSDAAFDVNLNLVGGTLAITSALRSQFFDAQALLDFARAFVAHAPSTPSGAALPPSATNPKPSKPSTAAKPTTSTATAASPQAPLPFWRALRGSFDLDLGVVQWGLYRIDRVHGRLDASDRALTLRRLDGDMFAGRWGGEVRIDHDAAVSTGTHRLQANFRIEQFESSRVVQTVFPNQVASIDARINLRASVSSLGDTLPDLVDHSEAQFSLASEKGVVRLTVPKADRLATAAVFGGTVLLSPELRALGRLLRKFSEMPVEQLRIEGRRTAAGEINLDQFRFDSPQARLLGRGRVAAIDTEPLMNRPLELSLQLAAKDELAVILGGMKLLEKRSEPDGFRSMREPFALGGRAGEPDTAPLFDLLAKAVSGSRGTWGFLMRKVQAEVKKKAVPAP